MNLSVLLPIISLPAISPSFFLSNSPEDIPLSFPFFQSNQGTGIPDELMVGYGDWCVASEGLHMGIDLLPASNDDHVLNPFDETMYSIGSATLRL